MTLTREKNQRTVTKTFPSSILSTTNPIRTGVELNADLCDERPSSNRLSHGIVRSYFSVREKRVESGSVLLPLEPQIDTIGSNVIDNGEIGNYSITMLSTVNYRRKRLLTMIPGELTSAQLSGPWRRNWLIICSSMMALFLRRLHQNSRWV